jgi:plastocyanin
MIQIDAPAVPQCMSIRSTVARVVVPPIALAIALGGCGSRKPSVPRDATILISSFAYHPARVAVAAGSAITFTNRDATAHTATSIDRRFDTGTMPPGQSRTVVLRTPGTYAYYCQFHAFMRGEITVSRIG